MEKDNVKYTTQHIDFRLYLCWLAAVVTCYMEQRLRMQDRDGTEEDPLNKYETHIEYTGM